MAYVAEMFLSLGLIVLGIICAIFIDPTIGIISAVGGSIGLYSTIDDDRNQANK